MVESGLGGEMVLEMAWLPLMEPRGSICCEDAMLLGARGVGVGELSETRRAVSGGGVVFGRLCESPQPDTDTPSGHSRGLWCARARRSGLRAAASSASCTSVPFFPCHSAESTEGRCWAFGAGDKNSFGLAKKLAHNFVLKAIMLLRASHGLPDLR